MLFFSFEYEREGLEPEKARAGRPKCLWHFEQRAVRAVRREEERQKGRRRRQPASGAKQAVKSFPRNQTKESSTEKVLFFSFEYEREGLEPEKARAGRPKYYHTVLLIF